MAGGKKVVVIGAGPGGYVAAIRASQLGARVTVVEKDTLGGTCLNVGCIPTKVLLSSVGVLEQIKNAGKFGIKVENPRPDFGAMVSRAEGIVEELKRGIEFLFKKNGVNLVKGRGAISKPGKVRVTGEGKAGEEIEADAIIVAVGSAPSMPEMFPFDGEKVITSNEAIRLSKVPGHLLIVGGGTIGLEFGCIFSALGSNVSVVEIMEQLIPGEDAEVAGELEKGLRHQNIDVHTGSKVENIEVKGKEGISAELSTGAKLRADKVLVAVGRAPDTKSMGLEELNLLDERGFIRVNEKMETPVRGIYAAGDGAGGLLLAHKASAEGVAAAESAVGLDVRMDYRVVPRCIFTRPEVACVGVSEEMARGEGREIKVAKFPFNVLGKARASGETEGMVKIVTDASSGEILGVHIIGSKASDLIGEPALAMKLEATVEDISSTIHAHPTLTEAIKEASLMVEGKAIHI